MERKNVERAKKGCKRCGSHDVAWHHSERGKWYLIEVFKDAPADSDVYGYDVASYRDFHSTYCGKPELHVAEQNQLDADFIAKRLDRDQRDSEREMQRLNDEAEKLRVFANLSAADRVDFMDAIQKKIDYENENWISMDYFSESTRQRAEVEAMKADLEMYEDFNADLEED